MKSYFSLITQTQEDELSRLINVIPELNEGIWHKQYLTRNIHLDYILNRFSEEIRSAEGDMYYGRKKAYFNDKHVQFAVKRFKNYSEHSKVFMCMKDL